MCEPATIIAVSALALSAASTYANYEAQTEQAKRMNAYQDAAYAANKENATIAYNADSALLNRRQREEEEAAAEGKLKDRMQAEKLKAQAVTSAGEANISGLSVDRLLSGIERDALNNEGTINRNLESTKNQAEAQKEVLKANFRSSVASVNPGLYQGPSGLATGLAIGGQVLNGISSSSALKDSFFGQKPTGGTQPTRINK